MQSGMLLQKPMVRLLLNSLLSLVGERILIDLSYTTINKLPYSIDYHIFHEFINNLSLTNYHSINLNYRYFVISVFLFF